jgi:hypothetical protein
VVARLFAAGCICREGVGRLCQVGQRKENSLENENNLHYAKVFLHPRIAKRRSAMSTTFSSFTAVTALFWAAGFAWAEPFGLDAAQENVRQGTAVAPEILRSVGGQVLNEAKPALRRSREASRIGQWEALDALDRARDMDGGPPIGALPDRPPGGIGRGRP